ncbi:MAG: DegT/DnrJ/EryC1/StrS family aminotransferase [Proteobacteria bacterium]|nr:DegT/DnrJ/EryC1/StrS family aminotransferase [Pseudomonadota bacterium]MBU1716081.1 DegT/DnrJ/EryC1/StrS family aminotransferase [Pseudomonadota bacterium]
MKVPLLDLKEQLVPLRHEIMAAVTEVIDSTGYIMGPKVEAFEKNIASYCGSKHAIGVASGTDALLVSLMALGVGPGDLVMTTPFTFFATLGSILRLGAKPLFVDIDPVTYNIDPDLMSRVLAEDEKLAKKVKVILPVHLYGQCADMSRIKALADQYGIPVLEDAAQAIGAACPLVDGKNKRIWRKAGTIGAAGCFSFFPSKNLGGIGDGGMIVTDDDKLAETMKIIRVHGGAPKYHHAIIGGNFRLDPIQAVVLDIKLKHLPGWHAARRENADLYNTIFEESGVIAENKVSTPVGFYRSAAQAEATLPDYHIYNQYVIRAAERDSLLEFLGKEGIGAEIYYPIPLHKQKCLAGMGYNELSFPESEKAAKETMALPIYPELTDEMQQYVVDRIAAFYLG